MDRLDQVIDHLQLPLSHGEPLAVLTECKATATSASIHEFATDTHRNTSISDRKTDAETGSPLWLAASRKRHKIFAQRPHMKAMTGGNKDTIDRQLCTVWRDIQSKLVAVTVSDKLGPHGFTHTHCHITTIRSLE